MLRRLGVAHDAGSAKPSLQDCLEAILEQSDGLIDDVLEGLRASVLGVQGKTLHALQNPSGKAAIEQLCARGDLVRQSFAHALRVAMYGGNALRHSVQPLVRFDDFQFLEEDQIDANIEMAMTQQEVMLAVDQVLPPLNSLVSSLMGWSTAQPHLNPIKPDSFVYALRESFAGQGIPDAVRSGLMTAAAGLLGVSLR
ncbi:MAG: hypothetical protein ACR2I0_03755, partial [Rhodoferax sp.]